MRRLFCVIILLSGLQVATAYAAVQPVVRASLSPGEVVVGSEVTLTVTLLVPTWLPKPPAFSSLELEGVVGFEPPDSSYSTSEMHAGSSWPGLVKQYKFYPLEAGSFILRDKQVWITYADPETIKPLQVKIPLPELRFSAVVPAGAQNLEPFLAGSSLVLTQELSNQADSYNPGDAIERRVTASLDGMQSLFIPPLLSSPEIPGLAVYPGSASTEDKLGTDGRIVAGVRNEVVTYVFERGGTYLLPAVTLRWWNSDMQNVETAELPAVEFHVAEAVVQEKTLAESVAELPRILILAVLLVAAGLSLSLYLFRKVVQGRLLVAWHCFFASELYNFTVMVFSVLFRDPITAYSRILGWQRLFGLNKIHGMKLSCVYSFVSFEKKLFGPDSHRSPVGILLRVKLATKLLMLRCSLPAEQRKRELNLVHINPG